MRPKIELERRVFEKTSFTWWAPVNVAPLNVTFYCVRACFVRDVGEQGKWPLFSERRRPGRSGMVAHACPGRRLATLPGCRHLEPTPERVLSLSARFVESRQAAAGKEGRVAARRRRFFVKCSLAGEEGGAEGGFGGVTLSGLGRG